MIELPDLPTAVAWLRASLHRGTPRPMSAHRASVPADVQAARDAQAADERWHRSPDTIGEHPAPLHLDLLDLLDEAQAVAEFGDEATVQEFVRRVMAALGMVSDGQLLDALCPWCGGRTHRHPVGGGRTMRVREIPDRKNRSRRIPVIVCEGDNCNPPSSAASEDERWHGMPTWLQPEWDELAKQLRPMPGSVAELADAQLAVMRSQETVAGAACAVCGEPVLPTGKGGQAAGYCGPLCRRAADAERKRVSRRGAA